jgi:hypothetical protein
MRALTMDEVSFVSGGGTPLAQQQEQAARDAISQQLEQMGFTPSQAVFLLGMSALLANFAADIIATATYIRNNATISMAFRAAGVGIGAGALALQLVLTPSEAL